MGKIFLPALSILMVLSLMAFQLPAAADPQDTGQTRCYDNTTRIPCPLVDESFYGQDAHYAKARSYTKLDSSGNEIDDGVTDWAAAKDDVTGLIWEVKHSGDGMTDDTNPHDADNTYSWYDSNAGPYQGTAGDGTNTEDFLKALNQAGFGGCSNWRLPTVKELTALVHRGKNMGPRIDTAYFPESRADWYWSSTSYAGSGGYAWSVDFGGGDTDNYYKNNSLHVRAVCSGQ